MLLAVDGIMALEQAQMGKKYVLVVGTGTAKRLIQSPMPFPSARCRV